MFDLLKKIFGCKHIYGEVQHDRFQYCKFCGEAKIAPRYNKCLHSWKKEQVLTVSGAYSGNILKYIYVLRCEHCGDMKREEFSA